MPVGAFGFLLENGTDFLLLESADFLLQEVAPSILPSAADGRTVVVPAARLSVTIEASQNAVKVKP